jgi:hypothetical protein
MNEEEKREEKEAIRAEGMRDDITKIPITKEAERLFSELVEKVNKGFEAGCLVRRDVASWVIMRFHSRHTDGDIREMRQDHLNEDVLLDSFYKKMKDAHRLPPEVRKLLLSTLNVDNAEASVSQGKKRVKPVPLGDENEAAS